MVYRITNYAIVNCFHTLPFCTVPPVGDSMKEGKGNGG